MITQKFFYVEEVLIVKALTTALDIFITKVKNGKSPFSDTLFDNAIGREPYRSEIIEAFIDNYFYRVWCRRLAKHCESSLDTKLNNFPI